MTASIENIDKEYLGKELINQGFETWFRYMFRVIEGKPFKIEPIHPDIFQLFQDMVDQKETRANLNVPPRSAKTTLSKWLCVYAMTIEPRCKFIYTSFNQNLLSDISKEVAGIMENPIYRAMYPNNIQMMSIEADPIDDFWREYIIQNNKKNTYTNRKIMTAQGGEILFAAIGSQITGSGCGIRGAKGFSGGLIIDDANKPADIHSQTMRDKCLRYFEETLLSRLNDSNVLILNVQQRLHNEDLSGHLIRRYKYHTLRKPLLDHNGVCQIPSQYTPQRIEELKFNVSMFAAQYQQEPIAEKGLIIKRYWWKYYNPNELKENGQKMWPITGSVIITADTAFKETKNADLSCLQVWELRKDIMIMRDMVIDRWEFPELIENARMMWSKWQDPELSEPQKAKYFFIEDKASGTPLQQTLSREGINAIAWSPREYEYPEDKVGRTKQASWDVFSGRAYLPSENKMSDYLVDEAALFAEDMSHAHDDSVDTFTMAHSIWKYYGGGQ